MEYTKLEKLSVGTEFVEFLNCNLFVTYVVVANDGETATMDSLYPEGYDFELTQEDIDIRIEMGVLPIYDTLETAKESVKRIAVEEALEFHDDVK